MVFVRQVFQPQASQGVCAATPRPRRASDTPQRDPAERARGRPRLGTAPGRAGGQADVRTREGPLPEAGLAPPGADPTHPQRQAQQAA